MFLGSIRYVLECSVLCPYFFLAWWVVLNLMTLDLANLCFRLMWILLRRACRWLEACSHWLTLNPPNMCSMMRVGYAMLLFECLWLELCLIVELTPDFANFLGPSNGNCWHYHKSIRGGLGALNLKIVSMTLASSQVKKEIQKWLL